MTRPTRRPPNRMQDLYPRLLGGLGLVWAVVLQRGALEWPSDTVWALYAVAWLGACVALLAGRRTNLAAGAMAGLAMVLFLGPGNHLTEPLALFWWLGLAVAVTDRRPLERALLVRVTVSATYGYACLNKLNPSFLAGEQIAALAVERSQLQPFESILRSDASIAIAVAALVTEGALAVALWFRRTRTIAAVVGVVMSLTFIYAAHNDTVWDVAFIIVLTMLLVVSYLAFFCPIRPEDDGSTRDAPARATGTSTA